MKKKIFKFIDHLRSQGKRKRAGSETEHFSVTRPRLKGRKPRIEKSSRRVSKPLTYLECTLLQTLLRLKPTAAATYKPTSLAWVQKALGLCPPSCRTLVAQDSLDLLTSVLADTNLQVV